MILTQQSANIRLCVISICLNKAAHISSPHLLTSAEGTRQVATRWKDAAVTSLRYANFCDILRFSERWLLRILIISDLTSHLGCHISEDPIPLPKLTPE